MYEEASSAAVVLVEQLDNMQQPLAAYLPKTRFNFDETGHFYCMASDKTIA